MYACWEIDMELLTHLISIPIIFCGSLRLVISYVLLSCSFVRCIPTLVFEKIRMSSTQTMIIYRSLPQCCTYTQGSECRHVKSMSYIPCVTGSWNEASLYILWTRVSSGTGQRYLSDSITVWLIDGYAHDWWTWRWYLHCLIGIALLLVFYDRFRVSCMWLDSGLIWCSCLYDSLHI
jgi:hypothetical protein